MKIYNFPIKYADSRYATAIEFQPLDLDYIVSIGPVFPVTYTGNNFGESHCYFSVCIKIGQSFNVTMFSGTTLKCPEELVEKMKSERLKLISAWENQVSV